MYLFLDTEFTNFINPDLISLGLISEDGRHEFYAEIIDYNYMLASPFVREEVLPLLEHIYGDRRQFVAGSLHHWIQTLPIDPVVIVDYNVDWILFKELVNEVSKQRRNVEGD